MERLEKQRQVQSKRRKQSESDYSVDSFIANEYDPPDYGSEEERYAKKRNRKRKAETGFGGQKFVFYEDRSEYSDDLDEANYDDIEEEEFISGAIGAREDEEEYLRQKSERRRRKLAAGVDPEDIDSSDDSDY